MITDNSLAMVSKNLSLKDSIEELLLLQKKVPFFSGGWCVEGVKDFTDILCPCLITEGLVPGVIELLILQGRKQARVTLDPAAKELSRGVLCGCARC